VADLAVGVEMPPLRKIAPKVRPDVPPARHLTILVVGDTRYYR
jgi:hypothetical protein